MRRKYCVANSTGLKTDWRGYTVVPYATSYRENRIALDAASLKRNVDLENAVVNVVPTKGALVLAEFNPCGGRGINENIKAGYAAEIWCNGNTGWRTNN